MESWIRGKKAANFFTIFFYCVRLTKFFSHFCLYSLYINFARKVDIL